jgi:hypothetical protein
MTLIVVDISFAPWVLCVTLYCDKCRLFVTKWAAVKLIVVTVGATTLLQFHSSVTWVYSPTASVIWLQLFSAGVVICDCRTQIYMHTTLHKLLSLVISAQAFGHSRHLIWGMLWTQSMLCCTILLFPGQLGSSTGLQATLLYQPREMFFLLVMVGVTDLYLFQMTSQLTTSSHSTCQRRRIVTTLR